MVATHVDRSNGAPVEDPADRDGPGRAEEGAVPDDQAPGAGPTAGESSERRRSRTEAAAVGAAFVAAFAFVAAIFAVGLAARAVTEARDGTSNGQATAPAAGAATGAVTLADFSIEPADLTLDGPGTLTLENTGAVAHNLVVDGVASDMIDPGGTGELDLSGLAPGTYDMWCDVPGHKAAGMSGTLTIG